MSSFQSPPLRGPNYPPPPAPLGYAISAYTGAFSISSHPQVLHSSQVVAVAARDLSRAKEFARKHDIPKAYGSYEELAKDPNVGE